METLAYYASGSWTEISLTALGVDIDVEMALNTHGVSKFTLPLRTTPPETAVAVPFRAPCILWTGRSGSGSSWSGGTKLFQGWRAENPGDAGPGGAGQSLVIADAWDALKYTTMMFAWKHITTFSSGTPTYGTNFYWPDGILFQYFVDGQFQTDGSFAAYSPAPTNGHITTGQTIKEVLASAIFYGVNLQIGTIDPALNAPFYPVRSIRCDEAIRICLRLHPDCFTEIDYTTTPPTFNVRKQANLTGVTLPYKGTDSSHRTHLTSRVRPLPELIPSYVAIHAKITSSISGNQVITNYLDMYPSTASPGVGGLDVSVDMDGPSSSSNSTSATLTTTAFDPTSLAWWQQKQKATLGSAEVSNLALLDSTINGGSGHAKGITVTYDDGTAIDLSTHGCELLTGTPASWMQSSGGTTVAVSEANVTAFFSYTKTMTTTGSATPVHKIIEQQHTTRVKLTNLAGATYTATGGTSSTGELYPANLAQGIYTALQTLQYEFTHTILETPFATVIKPGKHCLNLTGGLSAWSTMNAVINAVEYRLMFNPSGENTSSKTTVHCGPVQHLDARELIEIFNLFTRRDFSKINPASRNSGYSSAGGTVTLGSDSPKENSTASTPLNSIHSVSSADGTALIQSDASASGAPVLTLSPVGGGAGAQLQLVVGSDSQAYLTDGTTNINIKVSDADGHNIYIQPLDVCYNGLKGKIYFLCSDFIPA